MRSLCIILLTFPYLVSAAGSATVLDLSFRKRKLYIHIESGSLQFDRYFALPSDSEYVVDITFKQDSEFPLTFTNPLNESG